MKKNILGSTILLSGLFLSGCSDSTPECNSDDTKQTVVDIAQREIKNLYWMKELHEGTFEVISVRTQSHDDKIDMYTCAAEINFTVKGNTTTTPITYTVQKTEDNDGTFYVEVFGL